jgi:catechol 2,3-dioxygenase-like lactoylglutathione lyase family enzyme
MKLIFSFLAMAALVQLVPATTIAQDEKQNEYNMEQKSPLKLGAFYVSINVKDLKTSKEFYEKLGFSAFGGSMEHNCLIMKNGNAIIGLFQGKLQGSILTFNPGWDENAQNLSEFDDIRTIQKQLKAQGIALTTEAEEDSKGPASLMLTDPDGNVILLDQHR